MAGGMARRAPSLDPCSCSSFSCHLLPPGPSSLARWADRAPPASCAVATLTAAAQDSSAVTRTDSSSAAAGGSSVLTRRPPGPPVIQSCEAASCGGRHPGRTTCLLAGALAAAGRRPSDGWSLPRRALPCLAATNNVATQSKSCDRSRSCRQDAGKRSQKDVALAKTLSVAPRRASAHCHP